MFQYESRHGDLIVRGEMTVLRIRRIVGRGRRCLFFRPTMIIDVTRAVGYGTRPFLQLLLPHLIPGPHSGLFEFEDPRTQYVREDARPDRVHDPPQQQQRPGIVIVMSPHRLRVIIT